MVREGKAVVYPSNRIVLLFRMADGEREPRKARCCDSVITVEECSSVGRATVSKTVGRGFEPLHSCRSRSGGTGRRAGLKNQ